MKQTVCVALVACPSATVVREHTWLSGSSPYSSSSNNSQPTHRVFRIAEVVKSCGGGVVASKETRQELSPCQSMPHNCDF